MLYTIIFVSITCEYIPYTTTTHIYHCFTVTCFNGGFVSTFECRWGHADAHKSGVSMQRAANTATTSTLCVSLHRPRAPGKPRTLGAAAEDVIQAPGKTSRPLTPPVFEISTRNRFALLRETECDAVIVGDSIVRHVRATLAESAHSVFPWCLCSRCFCADTRDPEGRQERRIGSAACGGERHKAEADGDTEEGLQELDRDGTQHIARDDDHRVRTYSHVWTRTQKVQQTVCFKLMVVVMV